MPSFKVTKSPDDFFKGYVKKAVMDLDTNGKKILTE